MTAQELQNTLAFYGVNASITGGTKTAFYTVYNLTPGKGCTLAKIKRTLPDINAMTGRKFTIDTANGIQLKQENSTREMIYTSDYTSAIKNGSRPETLPLIIGQDENGQKIYYDLCKMPHLLVAGSTGSGKSVFVHNCILSLLFNNKSHIILVDVKRVEFAMYEGLPHLAANVCYDTKSTLKMLKNLCFEMDNRYKTLQSAGCRNIAEYRATGGKMDYITLFIDELADLVLADSKTESYLVRLAQLGRAAGVHMILATQRPDYTVISGLIRANVPSRVCFATQKATDSRIILDQTGGETLRGNGDGLFLPIGSREPVHFQAPFASTDAIKRLLDKKRRVLR